MCFTLSAIYGTHSNDNNEVNAFPPVNCLHDCCCWWCLILLFLLPKISGSAKNVITYWFRSSIYMCTLISLFTLLSMSKVTFTRNNYVLDKLLAISFLPFACVNYLHVNNKYINCILSNSKTEIMLTHGDPECVFLNRRLTHLPATFNICVNFTHST